MLQDFEEVEGIVAEVRIAVSDKKSLTAVEERLFDFQIKTLAAHLGEVLPMLSGPNTEEGLELVWPTVDFLFRDRRRRVSAAWHLLDVVGQAVGCKAAAEHMLRPLVAVFSCEDGTAVTTKHLKLFHQSFLLRLSVRLGTRCFLAHFAASIVEAVGGIKEFDEANADLHEKQRRGTLRDMQAESTGVAKNISGSLKMNELVIYHEN
jgi:hypothetical protein